jgi:hypothetical protein
MVELHIILSIFILCLLSLFDYIIFNEEILLTLCFLSFLFFCFSMFSDSVYNSFESRAMKFEQDLLYSFDISKTSLINSFKVYGKRQSSTSQFTILMFSLLNFLSSCLTYLEFKPAWLYYQIHVAKFNELITFNNNYILNFQKDCVIKLLYSLILKKAANEIMLVTPNTETAKKNMAFTILKSLCF